MAEAEKRPEPTPGKGKAFFDRADQVAESGNWDFAIQLYLEGIRREPANLDRGHVPLRDVGLKRKMQGGKSAGLLEQLKRRGGKEPVEALVNAEYLLSKNPGKLGHMVSLFKAARKVEDRGLIRWICDLLLESMRQAKRPNKHICVMLAEAYADIEEFSSAVQVCDLAVRAYPNDAALADKAKDLSARDTIKQGRYDGETSFVESVRDMEKQVELAQQDQLAQSRTFIEREIDKARSEYESNPSVPGKIDGLVDALLKLEEEGYENTAVDVLRRGYADTKQYRFKMRMDDVKVRQMKREINRLRQQGDQQASLEAARKLLGFELGMYAEQASQYPTDLSIKFELGRRQLIAGQVDEAIASLQQAQRDPKRRILATTLLGKGFARKGWHREAVETFQRALELEPGEERAKELHYDLGESLEATQEHEKALEHFSHVAQMDYNYRDVRERIEALRKKIDSGPGGAAASP